MSLCNCISQKPACDRGRELYNLVIKAYKNYRASATHHVDAPKDKSSRELYSSLVAAQEAYSSHVGGQ